jgi:hypothetical protein
MSIRVGVFPEKAMTYFQQAREIFQSLGLKKGHKLERMLDELEACTDVWPTLHGADPGWTLDNERNPLLYTSSFPSARFDRVLVRSDQLRPVQINLVGTDPISNALCPSDHFGLQVELSLSVR